jgi:hypothetical protein
MTPIQTLTLNPPSVSLVRPCARIYGRMTGILLADSEQHRAVGFGASFPLFQGDLSAFYLGNQANSPITRADFYCRLLAILLADVSERTASSSS